MNARKHLRDTLPQTLPEAWRVMSAPRTLDALPKTPTVVLWTSKVARQKLNVATILRWDVETWLLLPPSPEPEAGEDRLDSALLDYIQALEADSDLTWSEAERGTLADTHDGYRVVVTLTLRIESE